IVPENDIILYAAPAEIEIAVFHPEFFSPVGILLNCKGRYFTAVENIKHLNLDLYLSGWHFQVLIASLPDLSDGLDYKFPPQLPCLSAKHTVRFHIKNELCNAVPVAEIHKSHPSQVPRFLHPSAKGDILSRISQ